MHGAEDSTSPAPICDYLLMPDMLSNTGRITEQLFVSFRGELNRGKITLSGTAPQLPTPVPTAPKPACRADNADTALIAARLKLAVAQMNVISQRQYKGDVALDLGASPVKLLRERIRAARKRLHRDESDMSGACGLLRPSSAPSSRAQAGLTPSAPFVSVGMEATPAGRLGASKCPLRRELGGYGAQLGDAPARPRASREAFTCASREALVRLRGSPQGGQVRGRVRRGSSEVPLSAVLAGATELEPSASSYLPLAAQEAGASKPAQTELSSTPSTLQAEETGRGDEKQFPVSEGVGEADEESSLVEDAAHIGVEASAVLDLDASAGSIFRLGDVSRSRGRMQTMLAATSRHSQAELETSSKTSWRHKITAAMPSSSQAELEAPLESSVIAGVLREPGPCPVFRMMSCQSLEHGCRESIVESFARRRSSIRRRSSCALTEASSVVSPFRASLRTSERETGATSPPTAQDPSPPAARNLAANSGASAARWSASTLTRSRSLPNGGFVESPQSIHRRPQISPPRAPAAKLLVDAAGTGTPCAHRRVVASGAGQGAQRVTCKDCQLVLSLRQRAIPRNGEARSRNVACTR